MTAHIDIDEIVPRAPLVGLKLLEGKGDLLAIRLLAGVDVTTEIVVQLDVLCLCAKGY